MIQLRDVLLKWEADKKAHQAAVDANKRSVKILEDALELIVQTRVETFSEYKYIAAKALQEAQNLKDHYNVESDNK